MFLPIANKPMGKLLTFKIFIYKISNRSEKPLTWHGDCPYFTKPGSIKGILATTRPKKIVSIKTSTCNLTQLVRYKSSIITLYKAFCPPYEH